MGTPEGSGAWPYYPHGWPKCYWCSQPALDGHLTCGDVYCNEGAARQHQQQFYVARECCGDQVAGDLVEEELSSLIDDPERRGVSNA